MKNKEFAELDKTFRRLKSTLLDVVETQLLENDPPETRKTLERLQQNGYSEKEAKIRIAKLILAQSIGMMRGDPEFKPELYESNLRRLR